MPYASRFLPLGFCLLFPFFLSAQLTPDEALFRYERDYLPEKVFVHTDKAIYAGGETIWAALYLVNGQTHRPDSLSQVIHVELHDPNGNAIIRKKVFAADGNAASELLLPADLVPGDYQLTAYTAFQRNGGEASLFRKTIRIVSGLAESGGVAAPVGAFTTSAGNSAGNIDRRVRFFPEGGDCVNGLPCRVAVVVEDAVGRPLAADGTVRTEEGQAVGRLQSSETGVGVLLYTPRRGETFRLQFDEDSEGFPLPAALGEGLHLEVRNEADSIRLLLSSGNLREGLSGATLLLHVRGIPLLKRPVTAPARRARFLLPKNNLPSGVLTATLFDANEQPVAERLFYVPPGTSELTIGVDSLVGQREPLDVTLALPVTDAVTDSLRPGRLSLSVVPAAASGGPAGDDIRSWLLFNSDLDRSVPDAPTLLFTGDETERRAAIDAFLLTRAWRRFRWADLRKTSAYQPEFSLERGIYLRGRMGKIDNRNSPRPGKVFLTRLENAFYAETMTDSDGHFEFGPYMIRDSMPVSLQGRSKFGKRNRTNDKIDLDDNNYVFLETLRPEAPTLPRPTRVPPPQDGPASGPAIDEYAELSRKSLIVSRTYDSLIIDLAVVDVVTRRIDKVKEERDKLAAIYGTPDDRLVLDSLPGAYAARDVLDILRYVAGVTITGSGPDTKIVIRGLSTVNANPNPGFFLNGQPTTLETLISLPIEIIEFVDVLKGASAAVFGMNGSNGVILVYTRSGNFDVPKAPGLINTDIRGYHRVREFAVFDAALPENRNRPDLRTTLHWNPILRTNAFGRATDRIYTSDLTGEFIIVAQGLRKDGRPVFGTRRFRVK